MLLIAIVALMAFGLMMIGSATRANIMPSPQFDQQMILIPLGLIFFFLAAFIDYHFIARFYVAIYVVCVGLLAATLLYGYLITPDEPIFRWIIIRIGDFSVSMQPSEFAKVLMIIFLAKMIDKHGAGINNFRMLAFLGASIALPVGLVMIQPSLSASLLLLLITLAVLFAGNVGGKNILISMVLVAPMLVFLANDFTSDDPILVTHIFHEYQIGRVETILNPEAADTDARFQIERSIAAIGSGQLMGKGLHQGTITQAARLPAAETDFIISVIGEEFGFLGLMGVLLVMLFIVGKCMFVAATAPDMLGRLIATGVAMKLAFQSFINVGVVTELLPNTGVPFPFLSYGGSSLWTSMIAVGLVVNVQMSKSKSMFETFE